MEAEKITIEQVLDYAIQREEQAANFYLMLAEKVESSAVRARLKEIALEELGHKGKLESVKRAGTIPQSDRLKPDFLELYDFYEQPELNENISYEGALVLAIKREVKDFQFYKAMAEATEDAQVRDMLLEIAAEEAQHKRAFELQRNDSPE